jgi:hypothetical protein
MTYRLVIIEESDKYVLRYSGNNSGGVYITREYEKTADLDNIARQLDEILNDEAQTSLDKKTTQEMLNRGL